MSLYVDKLLTGEDGKSTPTKNTEQSEIPLIDSEYASPLIGLIMFRVVFKRVAHFKLKVTNRKFSISPPNLIVQSMNWR